MNFIDELSASLAGDSIVVQKIQRPTMGPQMGIEWVVFPAIALLLLKPYFEGFMDEAGRDHYRILRKFSSMWWGKLFGNNRELEVAVVTASGKKKSVYSVALAFYTILEDGRWVKLLLREDCTEDEFIKSIEAFVKLAYTIHKGIVEDKIKSELDNGNGTRTTVLVEYDQVSGSLRVVDPTVR